MVFLVTYISTEDIHLLKEVTQNDLIVGVDQGANILLENNIIPDYIIGDFDSFLLDDSLIPETVKIIELDKEKDYSDLEYAVLYFLNKTDLIFILNNMQGRTDHILLSLFLLEKANHITKIIIRNNKEEIRILENEENFIMSEKTLVSLIPLTESVTNIITYGLLYKLENETLYRHSTRGLSNVVSDSKVKISYSTGKLLLVSQYYQENL